MYYHRYSDYFEEQKKERYENQPKLERYLKNTTIVFGHARNFILSLADLKVDCFLN